VAVMTHTQKGDAVLLEADSHSYGSESGSLATVAGVMPHPIHGALGYISPAQVRGAVRPANVHVAPLRLICLENTHNRAGGIPFGPPQVDATCLAAHDLGLSVHVDGARIFNAAVALAVPAADLVRHADSVMFCISKGLSAPVGSVLLGRRDFVARARRFRKMVGGGMRQAGIIAAAGLVALRTMVSRLADDHANARRLAEGMAGIPGLRVDLERVRTNIVLLELQPPLTGETFLAALQRDGVLAGAISPAAVRLVTHRHITRDAVDRALAAMRRAVATPASR
jgi:threonine aldolase